MNQAVTLGIVVAFAGMIGPVLLAIVGSRSRRAEKEQDWAREDEVAARAAKTAAALLAATDRTGAKVEQVDGKVDVIHTLVNSGMTAAIESELEATVLSLASMREVAALRKETGRKPSTSTLAAIKAAEQRLALLRKTLAERAKQAKVVADQQANQASRRKGRK